MIQQLISKAVVPAFQNLYQVLVEEKDIQINVTKPEFKGDYTVVLFPFIKSLKKSPESLGQELGDYLIKNHSDLFSDFNVIKGFLNLSIQGTYYTNILQKYYRDICFGKHPMNGKKVMVEYSSPNTNKPLHLGHLRNNFLGWSIAELLKANGYEVIKSCIVNDRGIHICKSMIAWQRFANGATPESAGKKGDHFVGDYYVKFNEAYKAETEALMSNGLTKEEAEKQAPIMLATQIGRAHV